MRGVYGHSIQIEMMKAVQDEFDEPVEDVILGLREQGLTWRNVAGAIGISDNTLEVWRRVLRLSMDKSHKVRDECSSNGTPCDRKAKALGYRSIGDAIRELRLGQKKSVKDTADILGIHYVTVSRLTPAELKGTVIVYSDKCKEQRRQWQKDMLERRKFYLASRNARYFNRNNLGIDKTEKVC